MTNKANGQTWNCGAPGSNLIATLTSYYALPNGDYHGVITFTGSGDMMDYVISGPWMGSGCLNYNIYYTFIIGDSVTSVGDRAFVYQCSHYIDSVKIGSSVTRIGERAFAGTPKAITIPNSVTTIGESAFYACNVTSIPNSVTTIGDFAFYGCPVTSIPSSVTSIGNWAFVGCNFTSLSIPNGITSIGEGTFSNCRNLNL